MMLFYTAENVNGYRTVLLSFFFFLKYFIVPCRKFRSPYLGKAGLL